MKIKSGITIATYDETSVIMDESVKVNSMWYMGNKTATFINNCLKKEITYSELLKAITDHFEVEEEVAASQLTNHLNHLQSWGFLEN